MSRVRPAREAEGSALPVLQPPVQRTTTGDAALTDPLVFAAAWVFLAGLVGWFSESRGRGAWLGFGLAMLFSPLVGFLIVLFLGPKRA